MVDPQPSSPSLRVFEDDALDLPFHLYRMRERVGFEPRWIQNLVIAGGSEHGGSGKGDKRLRNLPLTADTRPLDELPTMVNMDA